MCSQLAWIADTSKEHFGVAVEGFELMMFINTTGVYSHQTGLNHGE